MYPPNFDPSLLRYQQIFGQQQPYGSDMPEQGGFLGFGYPEVDNQIPQQPVLPERLGQSAPLGGLPSVIDPSMIGSESIPETEESRVARRLQELYSPETTASDRLSQLLGQYPQREKPGVWRKIGASIVGMGGGIEAADRALNAPHNRAVEDWQRQVRPAEYAANQERYNNSNERMLANQVMTQERNDRKFDHTVEKDKKSLELRERRTQVYEWKTRNPNMIIKMDNEGNFVGINPQTGKPTYITDADGQPINGREMSWQDKQNILQENALERIGETAKAGLNRIGASGVVQEGLIQKRASVKAEEDDDPTELTPSARRTQQVLNAQEALMEHPEWEGKIEIDGSNVRITETDPALREKIKQAITGVKPSYGLTKSKINQAKQGEVGRSERTPIIPARPPQSSVGGNQKLGTSQPNINPRYSGPPIQNSEDRVNVRTPQGEVINIPREQLETAVLKYGYKPIYGSTKEVR